jgi:hypothetical protein
MHSVIERKNRRGIVLGSFILACLVVPQVYWWYVGYSKVENWEKSLWGFVAGATFLSSYYFREQTFLFRSILWILRTIHIPPGEWLAFVYGVLFFAISIFILVY